MMKHNKEDLLKLAEIGGMFGLLNDNLALATDGYKVTHWLQFPKGTNRSFYYLEARGGKYEATMVAGCKYLAHLLSQGITAKQVEDARAFYKIYFGGKDLFNYEGWMRIVNEFGGKLPVRVRCVEEGMVVPIKNVLVTIESTEDGFGWLCGYLETLILRAVWYSTTVATISFETKKSIKHFFDKTTDLTGVEKEAAYRRCLVDFGSRGVSSGESTALGGMAHQYNFTATDNVESAVFSLKMFGEIGGFTIPAREHSTTTCYLNEDDAFMNSVEEFGEGDFAMVMDSYDYEDALKRVTCDGEFRKMLTEKGGVCILRPDSGCPIDVVMTALQMVARNVGYTRNSKGYKILDKRFRVIQGDGVDGDEVYRILSWMESKKFAAENVSFGMGGGLLQRLDRDTQRFAMKCSAMEVDHIWREVFKAPKTDMSKASKKGFLDLLLDENGEYYTSITMDYQEYVANQFESQMTTLFENGETLYNPSLDEVQYNAELTLR